MTTTSSHCAECGATLPKGVPRGLCSRCALAGALELADGPAERRSGLVADAGGAASLPTASLPTASLPTASSHAASLASASSPTASVTAASMPAESMPVASVTAASLSPASEPFLDFSSCRVFGDYELIEEIARGGMGIVFKARQVSLDRIVAVKMLLFGPHSGAKLIQRFKAEAVAAGSLRHSNIVAVHEVGMRDGQQFMVMDYINGPNLARMVQESSLSPKRAATYVKTIAEAIHYAHEQGILHRDLKPSNVLVDSSDQPRVTDFGLARRLEGDSTSLTLSGQVVGSPNFIPPEQAGSGHGKVSRRSDVYGLGAILYHLLTGRAPFHGETIEATLHQVLTTEPISPRLLNPSVPKDLDTICLKCLQKEQDRRYATAQELSDELSRFLRDEPILARPIGPVEQAWRWSRRHPKTAVLVASLQLVFVLGVSGILWQWWRAERHATAEARQRQRAEEALHVLELERVEDLFRGDNSPAAVAMLSRMVRQNPTNRVSVHRLVSALTLRNFALPTGKILQPSGHFNTVRPAPQGEECVLAMDAGGLEIWDLRDGRVRSKASGHDVKATSASYSRDGRWIVSASADQTARIWDANTGQAIGPALKHSAAVMSAEFSVDARWVATVTAEGALHLWEAQTGKRIGWWYSAERPARFACFGPDSRRALVSTAGRGVFILKIDSANAVLTKWKDLNVESEIVKIEHGNVVEAARFSPDGRRVVTCGWDNMARIWDADTGALLVGPIRHDHLVYSAEFSQDGRWLVTAAGTVARIWDTESGQPITEPFKHESLVVSAQFTGNGRFVLTSCNGNLLRLWEVNPGKGPVRRIRHEGQVRDVQFSPDGTRVLTASEDCTARVWDADGASPSGPPMTLEHKLVCAAFSPDGKLVLTGSRDGQAQLWDAKAGQRRGPPLRHEDGIRDAKFNVDGSRVITASKDSTAKVWETSTGRLIADLRGHEDVVVFADISRDGSRVVTASLDETAKVWDARTGQLLMPSLRHEKDLNTAVFSPNGRFVLSTSDDTTARLWDTGSATNGTRAASSAQGSTVDEPVKSLLVFRHEAAVFVGAFSPDGRYIITGSGDKTARVWDAVTGKPVTGPLAHEDRVTCVSFSPNGTRVLTASRDGTARIWDAQTGFPLSEPLQHDGWIEAARFSPNGQWVATASRDDTARIWETPVPPLPAPDWLPALAEALAGLRFNADGMLEPAPHSAIPEVSARISGAADSGFYRGWAQRLLPPSGTGYR